ncbi:MAG: ComF family protein [Amoebophilaceae bacterium]|jgi:ComF family protein|nr:ComF family protein [Amoebophilaceae bacterium]
MLQDFINLFFPHYCLTCQEILVKGETLICTVCFLDLPPTTCHQEPENIVAQRLAGRLPISHAMALYKFRKSGKVQCLLHHLKYGNKPLIGKVLGRRFGALFKEAHGGATLDLIIPVPLHSSKLRKRGYNQSDFFAQGIAEVLHIPWSNQHLKRATKAVTQTKMSKLERFKSVENAFVATNISSLHNKHILLVDDVMTTGATLEACGLVLLAAGIKELSVATIAVTTSSY